ncbi:unnamed protein product [Brassicogethes aeneus]|uniref:Anaphase-promoting complex subunit 1 n=1 Tax=Brassicogethes aeneus TaxID=1431903 RepID=A0A9P0B7R9_BRAAE|nr:unnamed protein product [Brassicogethes aeneus]
MIAASEPQEFVPSGRQQATQHALAEDADLEVLLRPEDLVLKQLENISLADTNQDEWWILRKTPRSNNESFFESVKSHNNKSYSNTTSKSYSSYFDESKHFSDASGSRLGNKRLSVDEPKNNAESKKTESTLNTKLSPEVMEDELYVKGNTTIWSRGLVTNEEELDNGRVLLCCYTSPLPVKQALWCTFYCERPIYDTNLEERYMKIDEPSGIPVPSICIIDEHNIRIFTEKGEDFVITVPFKINKVWTTRFGLLVEKTPFNTTKETQFDNQANLYSLAYPLDDVCQVTLHQNCLMQILNNPNWTVVFTCDKPSICMIYDSTTRQHSVFRIRHLKPEEKNFSDKASSMSHSRNLTTSSKQLKHRYSMWDIVNSQNILSSPSSTKPSSPCPQSRSLSSMATISRCQSPAASSVGSPWMPQRSRISTSALLEKCQILPNNNSFFDSSKTMSHLRSNPTICLDYLWTDNYSTQDGALAGPATKVFFSEDYTGQWYLCYILLARYQLSIVKVDFTSNSSQMSFGMLTSISAKDAVPIPHLHMLAILEHTGNVTLYSGLTAVGKLHLGGTLVEHTPSPYIRKNLDQFPKRSSLLPHCSQVDPQFDEHLFSPVLPPTSAPRTTIKFNFDVPSSKTTLVSLTDAIENRLTLKYSDGTYYRIALPNLASSPLVESCLVVIRQALQRDASITFLARWYATRNLLGSQEVTVDQEWNMFSLLLFELLGYDEDHPSEISKEVPVTPSSGIKRVKQNCEGCDDDWNFMINSDHNQKLNQHLGNQLYLNLAQGSQCEDETLPVTINVKSVLFPYIRIVHFTLHLLYEDLKLNALRSSDLLPLMKVLNKLSNDLGLMDYSLLYWKDFPGHGVVKNSGVISQNDLKSVNFFAGFNGQPISVMQHVLNLLGDGDVPEYPFLSNVNIRSRDIVQLCGILSGRHKNLPAENQLDSFVRDVTPNAQEPPHCHTRVRKTAEMSSVELAILLMVDMGITLSYLDTLPVGIYLLLYSALWMCRENPPSDWPAEAYRLLWREDLAAQALKLKKEVVETVTEKYRMLDEDLLKYIVPPADTEQPDGMEDTESPLLKLRFARDLRVRETRKMLRSSRPVGVALVQRPDVSDHDFIEEQEKHLFAVCTRTMALPIGRGMFTMRTSTPVITEPMPCPPLCLTGKAPPRGTTVDLSHIDTPANMSLWPLFHNGVANGLRISLEARCVDTTWIIFNKPKESSDHEMEHAGFLMALGLNGHLRNLDVLRIYDYLAKLHEMTSMGVLLGLSAAYRGTSNMSLTKTLSIHIEALLPPTSMELDVPQNLQVAALLGVGLVYQRTAHRHITEVLLSEIGRPPGPEMENCVDRESYSLAAGLALGMVTLKHGGRPIGLSDLNVPDTLHYYMVGGNKRTLTGSQKDKYKVPSFQVKEGSCVNLDVTAPGATMALGLMYLGTGNRAVADWMAPPETQYLLDFVRPDFLLLRILSRSLILWDDIEPSKEWVEGQVPSTIRPYCMVKPNPTLDVDYEAMNQAYCNIIAGACFALGLKFAGSSDKDAFDTLIYFCHLFTKLTNKSIAELAGRATIETCLNAVLLSASMVMAGTGNLEIMRLVRHLRKRVGASSSAVVTYGSHLATHMALGLLYLGGGRYTLSNSPASVAALICALYPKFPTHSNDNRYHLQAFRHLYVLAVEPRVVIPRDVHLGKTCYANLRVVTLEGSELRVKGPGILPDLSTLTKVSLEDDRYWPVVFERGRNWDLLIKILFTDGHVEVKQRAGCLSYIMDRFGYQSHLARTLTQSGIVPWDPTPDSISSFTSEKMIKYFCDHFLKLKRKNFHLQEQKLKQKLIKVTYDAVIKDKLIIIYVFATLFKMVEDLAKNPSTNNIWQLKIIRKQTFMKTMLCNLISKEALISVQQEIFDIFGEWEKTMGHQLNTYLLGGDVFSESLEMQNKLANYVILYDIPYNFELKNGELLEVMSKLQSSNFSSETVSKLIKIIQL